MNDSRIMQALRKFWEVKGKRAIVNNVSELSRELDFLGFTDVAQWIRENPVRAENWLTFLGVTWQIAVQSQNMEDGD